MTVFGDFTEQVKERMIRYAKIDTQSADYAGTWPTTPGQMVLAKELDRELREIGVPEVFFDEEACIVYASLPENRGTCPEPVGLIAHMDTAPDVSGSDVKPWVLLNYGGGDIDLTAGYELPAGSDAANKAAAADQTDTPDQTAAADAGHVIMHAADYPNLQNYLGQDLIFTDGTTLLGGDDKAAIASLVTMAEYFVKHPEVPHGAASLAFTPDEEVGGLAHALDLARFGAKRAYTVDGDHLGWYGRKTFNASEAVLTVRGLSVHPGSAKGIMINAADIAGEFLAMLPPKEKPQYTEGLEGYYYVTSVSAECESARVELIIRDFDAEAFSAREDFLRECAEKLRAVYGEDRIDLAITEQYRNMYEVLQNEPQMIDRLVRAIAESGVTPVEEAFRGGTDGAALSFRGLPCPNLSSGYENAHGRFEYVPVPSLEKNVEILIRLCGGESAQKN